MAELAGRMTGLAGICGWSGLATALGVLAMGCGVALADQRTQALPSESIQAFSTPNAAAYIAALAPDTEGNMWFAETVFYSGSGTSIPSTLDRIDSSGVLTGEFAVPFETPSEPWANSDPNALAVDTGGNMWFTELGYNSKGVYKVGYATPAGTFNELEVPTPWSGPADIALGADGGMWFTEEGHGQIGRATKHGVREFSISSEAYPVTVGYHVPSAIALGPDGNMWFTDRAPNANGEDAIGRITPSTGEVTEFPIPGPYGTPSAIALGADGNMWFTQSPNIIGRITLQGTISEFAAAGVSSSLEGITLGSDGNIWFTEGNDHLGRITPTGDVTNFSTAAIGNGSSYAIARGLEGYLWYVENNTTENRVVRVAIPFAPVDEGQPAISGQAVEGQVLSAAEGRWAHAPNAFAYQWQSCDASGVSCANLAGQTEATHLLAASDVGHTLRAVVTASNIGGATAAMSAVSAVVQAAPRAPLPVPKPPPASEPTPVVGSAMTWNFGWARKYTIVESLVVRGVPAGGMVEVTCRGRGCAFTRWRSDATARRSACGRGRCRAVHPTIAHGEASLAKLFKGRRLKVGARVIVTVLKAGWIGKSFVFTMRSNKPPRVQITCLGSGSGNRTGEC